MNPGYNGLMGQAVKELTYGQKAVGLTFNPSGDETISKIKQFYADVIDETYLHLVKLDPENSGFKIELFKKAIMDTISAQMTAVKAITWKD